MKEPCGDNRCIKIGLEESFIKEKSCPYIMMRPNLIPHSQYMTCDKPPPAQIPIGEGTTVTKWAAEASNASFIK
jgi:hypothetical protein